MQDDAQYFGMALLYVFAEVSQKNFEIVI